ncbi:MAG: type 1 glutamine amidotransferase [Candidatus Omnitrophica bacterium]|nr:type 1 glutamine amidotransferase [Candidatus Omnitrophota bacterium]
MVKKILVVKNISREGPGLFETFFSQFDIPFQIVDLEQGDFFPSPASCAALVIMGGPDSANDLTLKMKQALDRVRECLCLGVPVLGVCLGLQVLVKAAGGRVLKSPLKEVGFRDPGGKFFEVELTQAGRRDPLFQGIAGPLKVFQLHGETVELGESMTLLGSGKFCTNQIVRVGQNAYGMQAHIELHRALLENWLKEDPDLAGLDADLLRADFDSIEAEYTEVARRFVRNFLEIAGLIGRGVGRM